MYSDQSRIAVLGLGMNPCAGGQLLRVRALRLLLLVCLAVIATRSLARAGDTTLDLVPLEFMTSGGFCPDAVVPELVWELGERGIPMTIWGTGCVDGSTGQIESARFLAPRELSMFVSGYIGLPGLRLLLRNVASGKEIELKPPSVPGMQWEHETFSAPPDWVGKPVQIVGVHEPSVESAWFGFTAPLLPYPSVAIGTIQTDRPQAGFCPDGVYPLTVWARGPRRGTIWGSYCGSGDYGTGWMSSDTFIAGTNLPLYVAGYPGSPGVRLSVENLQTGRQLPLQLKGFPREIWRQYNFPLPQRWKGQPIRVLAEDASAKPGGWLAFAKAAPIPIGKQLSFAVGLMALTLFLFVAWSLPAVAAAIFAASRGLTNLLDITAAALVTVGTVGYLAFWTYLLSLTAGFLYSWLSLVLCAAVIAYAWPRARNKANAAVLRRIILSWSLVGLTSVFVISIAFVYGKPDVVQDYSSRRFGPPFLSIDNFIPQIFANDILRGQIPKPLVGDWLSSDRPPLQTGMVLWNHPWMRGNRNLQYQLLGVIFQLTCLSAVLAYLEAAKVSRKAAALTLAAIIFWGFTFLNSFYSWPKLLPVAFLFVVPGYLFTERYTAARSSWRVGAVVGAAASLAMLCHGGSAFGLIGLGLTLLLLRRVPSPRFIAAAFVAAALFYAPWMLYQKHYDPPGDRLLKWHLAGVTAPHPEASLGHLMIANYGKMGLEQIAKYKESNFKVLFDAVPFWHHPAIFLRGIIMGNRTQAEAAVASLRFSMFLHWFWSIDLFSFAPLAFILWFMFRRGRSVELRQASDLWLLTLVTLVIWCLIMFGPQTTQVHQGCYLTEFAAIAGGVLALWAISPRLAVLFTAAHVFLNIVLYVLLNPPVTPGVATFMGPKNVLLEVISALAAAGVVLILSRLARGVSAGKLSNDHTAIVSMGVPGALVDHSG